MFGIVFTIIIVCCVLVAVSFQRDNEQRTNKNIQKAVQRALEEERKKQRTENDNCTK